MKRFVLSAIAASMLATTGAYADNRPARHDVQYTQNVQGQSFKKTRKVVIQKKVVVKKQRWGKGQRVSDWRQRQAIRDYRRYGLRAPGRGQQWVRVGNDYLLIGVTTGIIASILAGR